MADRIVPEIRFDGFEEDWATTSIGQVASVSSGRDYKHLNSGPIPVYGTGGYMLSVDQALSYSIDAIGIGRKGTIDKPRVLRAPFWTVDTLFYVTPDNTTDLNFLNGLFNRVDWKSKDESTGVPSLSKGAIANVGVNIASLDEQRQVGTFFSQLDSLIVDHQKKLGKIQQMKTSLLQKMFPQGDADEPELRVNGFSKTWEKSTLGEVTTISSAARVHRSEWQSSGVPFYRASDVSALKNGTVNSKVYITLEHYERLTARSGRLRKGDLLVIGGGSIGVPYIVPSDNPLYSKDADLLWVRPSARTASRYLATYLGSPLFQNYLESISHTGTIAHYTIQQANTTPLPLPERPEQQAIGELFSDLDDVIVSEKQYIEKLIQAKTSLLQKMFV